MIKKLVIYTDQDPLILQLQNIIDRISPQVVHYVRTLDYEQLQTDEDITPRDLKRLTGQTQLCVPQQSYNPPAPIIRRRHRGDLLGVQAVVLSVMELAGGKTGVLVDLPDIIDRMNELKFRSASAHLSVAKQKKLVDNPQPAKWMVTPKGVQDCTGWNGDVIATEQGNGKNGYYLSLIRSMKDADDLEPFVTALFNSGWNLVDTRHGARMYTPPDEVRGFLEDKADKHVPYRCMTDKEQRLFNTIAHSWRYWLTMKEKVHQ
jgi:hypothetical protein